MNRALFNRRARQVHLWLGLVIGIQVGLWLVSGLFMTIFPIENVRGEHLRATNQVVNIEISENYLPLDSILNSDVDVESLSLELLLGEPVWRINSKEGRSLVNAISGEILTPLSEENAVLLATDAYVGSGSVSSLLLMTDPPREYSGPVPVWKIEFGPEQPASFYIDANTGDVRAVRTTLWRVFDFMWGLHIMDWSTRENFNSWWIKMTATLAVLFFIAGFCLSILRIIGWLDRHRRAKRNS